PIPMLTAAHRPMLDLPATAAGVALTSASRGRRRSRLDDGAVAAAVRPADELARRGVPPDDLRPRLLRARARDRVAEPFERGDELRSAVVQRRLQGEAPARVVGPEATAVDGRLGRQVPVDEVHGQLAP